MKKRLDLYLLEAGLASTRTKAHDLIKSGAVKINEKVTLKAGAFVDDGDSVTLLQDENPFVSRGGLKLAYAIKEFSISIKAKSCLDIGQSTGGFTHVLLNEGANKVFGIEVGHGQLHADLRNNSKVVCIEGQDIRSLDPSAIDKCQFFCVDVSFISVQLIIAEVKKFLALGATGVILVKPQFEVGKDNIGKGVVTDIALQKNVLKQVIGCAEKTGFQVIDWKYSPIKGGDGNIEFLVYLKWL